MLSTTAGQFLINESLPPDLRDYNRVLDMKGIKKLFQDIAEKHPDNYKDITKKLFDIARTSAYETGGYSFALEHLTKAKSAKAITEKIRQKVNAINMDNTLSKDEKEKKILETVLGEDENLTNAVYKESLEENNPIALQVKSGARGKPMNLRSLRGADLTYVDHRDRPIPIPILRSYSEGLSPAEYFAAAFGARKGIIDVKFATQDAGYFSKQLNQATHRLMVSATDSETEPTNIRGLPVDTNDSDNEGALLAYPVGGYPRNTVLTPKILNDLQNKGIDKLLVRSPLVGGPEDGGVYARDVGVRERGTLAPIGDMVGITASQALSEPLSQSQLSSKHSGGVAGAAKGVSGFKLMDQLVQVPKTFPGGATHAQIDGRVEQIVEAPAGGHYVTISGERHYVPSGLDLKVKKGDPIEAGDVLSAGIPNPSEIVKHKGIGEGRRYYANLFKSSLTESGIPANRRNVELLARGLINHVRITEEMGEYVPGDVLPYNVLESRYQPREGHKVMDPKQAVGHYLEEPVLHYSIGTKIRPTMIPDLQRYGVSNVKVHPDPAYFEPEMVRGMQNVTQDPDWMTKMLGSNQQRSLLSSVHRGNRSDEQSTSFVPALAKAEGFGITSKVKDWHKTPKELFSD